MLARWAAFEASRGADTRTLSSWLDRQLVALAQRCAKFSSGDAGSVTLPTEFTAMPELIFHLRRSAFLNVFGNAPDETVFYRSLLFRCCSPVPGAQRGCPWPLELCDVLCMLCCW